jgi:hypothetical protein
MRSPNAEAAEAEVRKRNLNASLLAYLKGGGGATTQCGLGKTKAVPPREHRTRDASMVRALAVQ